MHGAVKKNDFQRGENITVRLQQNRSVRGKSYDFQNRYPTLPFRNFGPPPFRHSTPKPNSANQQINYETSNAFMSPCETGTSSHRNADALDIPWFNAKAPSVERSVVVKRRPYKSMPAGMYVQNPCVPLKDEFIPLNNLLPNHLMVANRELQKNISEGRKMARHLVPVAQEKRNANVPLANRKSSLNKKRIVKLHRSATTDHTYFEPTPVEFSSTRQQSVIVSQMRQSNASQATSEGEKETKSGLENISIACNSEYYQSLLEECKRLKNDGCTVCTNLNKMVKQHITSHIDHCEKCLCSKWKSDGNSCVNVIEQDQSNTNTEASQSEGGGLGVDDDPSDVVDASDGVDERNLNDTNGAAVIENNVSIPEESVSALPKCLTTTLKRKRARHADEYMCAFCMETTKFKKDMFFHQKAVHGKRSARRVIPVFFDDTASLLSEV